MADYLTEAAYQRWYRQYQTNLGYYAELLDNLRIRLDALPHDSEAESIEALIEDIDTHLDEAIPRNFVGNGSSLEGFEKFLENLKVFINLILRISGKPDKYLGIYHAEKDKVMLVHQQFKFKDKLNQVRNRIEALEAENLARVESQDVAQPVVAQS